MAGTVDSDAMETDPTERVMQAIRDDGRYAPAAFAFLQRGLEYTTHLVYSDDAGEPPRHVSGQQLCEGLRALAVQAWGPLAPAVLRSWNIHRTRDFGEMVYFLIGLHLMGKQESDRIEDFDAVYDLDQAFGTYQIPLEFFDRHQSDE
jgi:uncharacterized repeat protein (TIGR04138 family)